MTVLGRRQNTDWKVKLASSLKNQIKGYPVNVGEAKDKTAWIAGLRLFSEETNRTGWSYYFLNVNYLESCKEKGYE